MTRNEIKLALNELQDAYTLRIFLDNQSSVLAHGWSLVEEKGDGHADAEGSADGDGEGLLRVTVGTRQALIAISRIVVIQKVPFGW